MTLESLQTDPFPAREPETILIVHGTEVRIPAEYISTFVGDVDVVLKELSSLDSNQISQSHEHYAIIIILVDKVDVKVLDALQSARLKEEEPSVIVVSASAEPQEVAELYNRGCDKFLVRSGAWSDELGPMVRHLLRMRRLEAENQKLVAKLTEANALLEEKNRRLDDFSATVAHDIRGPLGGVSMKLEYILDTYKPNFDERCQKLLSRALESTQRLTGVVQAMYEFAKLGSKAARMSEVNLSKLVEEVLNDMNFDPDRDIRFGVVELPTVWGNAELIRRMFINLIGNAVKYNDKPSVIVNIGFEKIVERNVARFAEIFVEDNGPGIPEDEIKNVFTMFSRGERAKQQSDGEGIGLAVVHRIVELHFGVINASSRVGEGTRFNISLPMERTHFLSPQGPG